MSSVVFMDTDRVQKIADGFDTASSALTAVSAALGIAMNTLRATAFIGLVGGIALERYIAAIKPQIDHMAEYCAEMHTDLEMAADSYIKGAQEGACRFF